MTDLIHLQDVHPAFAVHRSTASAALLAEIDAYLARTGMRPTPFGRIVADDKRLVSNLRNGRRITLEMEQRVRAFMAGEALPVAAQERRPTGRLPKIPADAEAHPDTAQRDHRIAATVGSLALLAGYVAYFQKYHRDSDGAKILPHLSIS